MMKKFLLAPAVAALAMFAWGFLFWGAPHHLPYKALTPLPDEAAAGAALTKIFPVSGSYLLPSMLSDATKQAELMERGPIATVHFLKSGRPMMSPALLGKGYLHEFMVALVLVFMLDASGQAFRGFGCRVRFCGTIGLLVALYDYGNAIWWNHSIAWVTMQAVYDFIAFFVAGLVLGKILTPKVTRAAVGQPACAAV